MSVDKVMSEFDPLNTQLPDNQLPDVSPLMQAYEERNLASKVGNPFKKSGIFHVVHDPEDEQM